MAEHQILEYKAITLQCFNTTFSPTDPCMQWRTKGVVWWVSKPPPPPPKKKKKFHSSDKADPNSQFREKYIKNNQIRIRVSLICKLSATPV
jgi:hypothetical protein